MNFPEAAQVMKDIKIPNDAKPTGMIISLPLRKAKIAETLAINEIPENIFAPVAEAIIHSLISTHSLFRTKP